MISIYDHERPIEELIRCYALHELSSLSQRSVESGADRARAGTRAEDVDGAEDLQTPDDSWDAVTQQRLDLFLGSENYDNRIDDGGMIVISRFSPTSSSGTATGRRGWPRTPRSHRRDLRARSPSAGRPHPVRRDVMGAADGTGAARIGR